MIAGLKCRPQSARAVLQTVSFAQRLRLQVSSLVPSDKPMHPTPNPGDEVRRRTNSQVLHHVREQRHNAAVLRKSLVELEEEVKALNRAKHAVEVALQNTRKRMSTNHQALTMRERMHKHMVCTKPLYSMSLGFVLFLCSLATWHSCTEFATRKCCSFQIKTRSRGAASDTKTPIT